MELTFNSSDKIGSIVAKFPKASEIFREHHIDFCCGGDRPLRAAIEEQKLNEKELLENLTNAYQNAKKLGESDTDWWSVPLSELADHIVNTHHVYLNEVLPKASLLVTKILRAHGPHHPELAQVYKLFHTLKMELEQHLITEETILFPTIREYIETPSQTNRERTIKLIEDIEREHVAVGDILKELRQITDGYIVPADGCGTYHAAYQLLHEIEGDIFQHVHLENNIFFQRINRDNP